MTSRQWENMNEADFDSLLENSLPEQPPDEVAGQVTPWRDAMEQVLVGLAFNTVTLNFLQLNHIFPAVGLLLLLLGFRTLRKDNAWFKACWLLTLIRAACFFPLLALNATILRLGPAFDTILTVLNLTLILSQCLCLWQGFLAVQRKAGLPPKAKGAAALIIWYILLCLLALVAYSSMFVWLAMIAAYIFIIRSLFKLSKELDQAGYVIQTAPVRIPDRTLVWSIVILTLLGLAAAYMFGRSYPMEWRAAEAQETTEAAEIKAHLIQLGFPAEILADVTDQDILACRGALRVVTDVHDHPMNAGREVVTQSGNTTYHKTVYDVEELRITGVAVEIPDPSTGRERWKIFHHFLWVEQPDFFGTESLQLWPAYRRDEGWGQAGETSGQVLYSKDGQDYTAPYYSLGEETYTGDSIFWGQQTSTDIFAAFSLPRSGERQRGYISYTIQELRDGMIVDSWVNYTHQYKWLQYPALTAPEYQMAGYWSGTGAFRTVQDALQFYPTEESARLLSEYDLGGER